jgi:hypothetical protein
MKECEWCKLRKKRGKKLPMQGEWLKLQKKKKEG